MSFDKDFFKNKLARKKFCNANANADGDEEVPMVRFPSGQSLVNKKLLRNHGINIDIVI